MMTKLSRFFVTYRKTEGLDAFPENDRWWTYRKAFNKLLKTDRKFQFLIISFVGWVLLWCLLSSWLMNQVDGGANISVPIVIVSYALLLIVFLLSCFWIQGVQNRRIAKILPEFLREPNND